MMLLLAALAAAGCRAATPDPQPTTNPKPAQSVGQTVTIMPSARHIARGAKHEAYNTDPPSSGPHYDEPAKPGFYSKAPPDEEIVHSLEHGYVVIWYSADDLQPAERDQLIADIKTVMSTAKNSIYTDTPKLIAAPRPTLKSRVALTSWGHTAQFDEFDKTMIARYIELYIDRAPENQNP